MRALTIIVLVVALAAMACSSSPAPTQAPAQPPAATAAPASAAFGSYADSGKAVFAASCASCHGANGEGVSGPPVIGPSAALAKYGTAQGLLDFISAAMPMTAPGSLSPDQYRQVLSYLLVQGGYVPSNMAFSAGALSGISLKK